MEQSILPRTIAHTTWQVTKCVFSWLGEWLGNAHSNLSNYRDRHMLSSEDLGLSHRRNGTQFVHFQVSLILKKKKGRKESFSLTFLWLSQSAVSEKKKQTIGKDQILANVKIKWLILIFARGSYECTQEKGNVINNKHSKVNIIKSQQICKFLNIQVIERRFWSQWELGGGVEHNQAF